MKTTLVTGGSGFLGMHLIYQLLNAGYEVRTTVRSMKKRQSVIDSLQEYQVKNIERLTFFEADLSQDDGWEDAMDGVDTVFSVASPVFFDEPKDEAATIKPAIEGIIRILKAADQTNVKKVIMTSNFGAVGFSRKKSSIPTTENDWTDIDQTGISLYEKSKLIAEKAAWDFVNKEKVNFEFTTINPVAMFGPSMNQHLSGSFDLITNLLDGSQKYLIDLPLNIVDVRDVARMHVLAMENPRSNGQRYIVSADGQISMSEIAKIIKDNFPEISKHIPAHKLPDCLIKFAAMFSSQAKMGKLFLDINRNVSTQKAFKDLNWSPEYSNQEIILQSINGMKKYGLV